MGPRPPFALRTTGRAYGAKNVAGRRNTSNGFWPFAVEIFFASWKPGTGSVSFLDLGGAWEIVEVGNTIASIRINLNHFG